MFTSLDRRTRATIIALLTTWAAGCSESHAPSDGGGDGRIDASRPRDAAMLDAPYVPPDAGDGGCVAMPVVDPRLLPECPFCSGGRCISGDALPADAREQLADCSPSHECVPDDLLASGGFFTPMSCRSVFGVEGRCLSTCLPAVMGAGGTLPIGSCPETHRCVPCFDPLTGTETGACSVSCDPGPSEPPVIIATCCEDRGYCVPSDLVAESARDAFAACEGDALCVPIVIARTPGWTPPSCTSATYGPGACLHECMPAVAPYSAFLEQEDCPDELSCVPCRSPIDGRATGACAGVTDDGGVSDAGVSDAGVDDAGVDGGP